MLNFRTRFGKFRPLWNFIYWYDKLLLPELIDMNVTNKPPPNKFYLQKIQWVKLSSIENSNDSLLLVRLKFGLILYLPFRKFRQNKMRQMGGWTFWWKQRNRIVLWVSHFRGVFIWKLRKYINDLNRTLGWENSSWVRNSMFVIGLII